MPPSYAPIWMPADTIKGATPIDAIVMASAAQRGDVVYTTDVSDLAKLASYFRAVRVLSIG